MTETLHTTPDTQSTLTKSLQLLLLFVFTKDQKAVLQSCVRFLCLDRTVPFHKVMALTIWDGGRGGHRGPPARPLGQGPGGLLRDLGWCISTPTPARGRDRKRPAGPRGRGAGVRDEAARPASGRPPPSPPGPLRLVP